MTSIQHSLSNSNKVDVRFYKSGEMAKKTIVMCICDLKNFDIKAAC